jgi:DNA-binding MarR family transcriptional regulator
MRLTDTDSKVIRELLKGSPDQATLANALAVPKPIVAKSLLRLRDAGLVELGTDEDGRKRRPCLTIFGAISRLESAVKDLVGVTLAGAA